MTSQEAIRLLDEQRNKHIDTFVHYGKINEAYDIAIELLKKQEAKQILYSDEEEWWDTVYVCPDCNARWMSYYNETHFCPNCGRAVEVE